MRAEHRGVDAAQRLELGVAQDRVRDHQLVGVVGPLGQQVGLGADARADRHHDRLADRVDRRVGDLREQLLEVGEQRRRLVGQHGQREVVAHRADRLLALGRHRREQHAQVLLRVAERELARPQRLARARAPGAGAGPPGARRPRRTTRRTAWRVATRSLTSSSATIRPSARSTRNSLPGCRRPLRRMLPGGSSSTPDSEREHDPAVARLHPASGTQAVAVERRADHAAVGEGDRRRAVPRLHHARVERVERAQVLGQVVAPLPRLRHHHHQRVREAAAGEHRAARARCRTWPSPSRRGARPAAPSRGRRRTARTRAATRARASS